MVLMRTRISATFAASSECGSMVLIIDRFRFSYVVLSYSDAVTRLMDSSNPVLKASMSPHPKNRCLKS